MRTTGTHVLLLCCVIVNEALISVKAISDLYVGCFNNQNHFIFKGELTQDQFMSTSRCIDFCSNLNYSFAGTEAGYLCFCGTGENILMKNKIHDNKCNIRCSGSRFEICGGNWKITIFNLTVTKKEKVTESPVQLQFNSTNFDISNEAVFITNTPSTYDAKTHINNGFVSNKQPTMEIGKKIQEIQKLLKIDKSNISSTLRRKVCALDDRPSARAIGWVGSFILITLVSVVVFVDVITCLN